jgi:spore germination cell wall hydrolase CwlJ-like protein
MEKVLRLLMLVIGVFVIGSLVSTLTLKKINTLKETQFVSSKDVVSIRDRERQLDCLAKNIYHEAAGESFEGKVAVAQVTMNRAESGKFPSDVCAVVYQKNVFYEKVVCQFSWYCQNGGQPLIRSSPVH